MLDRGRRLARAVRAVSAARPSVAVVHPNVLPERVGWPWPTSDSSEPALRGRRCCRVDGFGPTGAHDKCGVIVELGAWLANQFLTSGSRTSAPQNRASSQATTRRTAKPFAVLANPGVGRPNDQVVELAPCSVGWLPTSTVPSASLAVTQAGCGGELMRGLPVDRPLTMPIGRRLSPCSRSRRTVVAVLRLDCQLHRATLQTGWTRHHRRRAERARLTECRSHPISR